MAEIGSSCTARVVTVCEGSRELVSVELVRVGQSLDNVRWALELEPRLVKLSLTLSQT